MNDYKKMYLKGMKCKVFILVSMLFFLMIIFLKFNNNNYTVYQWGLVNKGQMIDNCKGIAGIDINLKDIDYKKENFDEILVAIIDTGIDVSHKDLQDNIYVNEKEIPNNDKDDDKNGFIDDVGGWDFVNNDYTVYDDYANDFHGTHIAGIIGAKIDGFGINGIAPNVKILPLKVLDGEHGEVVDIIRAIEYAENIGVQVINCSWDMTEFNRELFETIRKSNMLFICSGGKKGMSINDSPTYPACFNLENVLSVCAIDNRGEIYYKSSFGLNVDIAAPGVNIFSTLPNDSFGFLSGTSMAVPFVTGSIIFIKSMYPEASFIEIKEAIVNNATEYSQLKDKTKSKGLINISSAIDYVKKRMF